MAETTTHWWAEPRTATSLGIGLIALGSGAAVAVRPVLSMVALCTVLSVAAGIRWPVVPLVAVVVAGPLETAVTLPGSLAPVGLTKVASAFAVVAILGHALVTRHRFRGDQSYVLGLGVAAVAVLAAVASPDPAVSLRTALRLTGAIALLIVVSEFAVGPRLRTAFWAYSTVTAAVTIPPLVMFVTGQSPLLRTPTADPNDFAVLMAVALPISIFLAGRTTAGLLGRGVAAASAGLLSISVLLTLSRGAVAGLVVGLSWHLLAERRHRRALGGLLVVGLGALLAAAAALAPLLSEALVRKDVSASYNVTSRLSGWRLALQLSTEHPVLGVGPGRFGTYFHDGTDTPAGAFGLEVTHNTYLGVLAEMGLPALLVLLLLLGLSWARLTRLRTAPELTAADQGAAATLRTALLIALVATIFSSQEYSPPLWLLAGLTGALAASRRPERLGQECC